MGRCVAVGLSQAREAVESTTDAVKARSAEYYDAAHQRAVAVLAELRSALSWVVNLPPMTIEELRKLAEDGDGTTAAAAAGSEGGDAPATSPTAPKRWVSTVAASLLHVIEHVQGAVTSLTEYIKHKKEHDAGAYDVM